MTLNGYGPLMNLKHFQNLSRAIFLSISRSNSLMGVSSETCRSKLCLYVYVYYLKVQPTRIRKKYQDVACRKDVSWLKCIQCDVTIVIPHHSNVVYQFHARLIICYPQMNCSVVSIIIIVMNTWNVPRDTLRKFLEDMCYIKGDGKNPYHCIFFKFKVI